MTSGDAARINVPAATPPFRATELAEVIRIANSKCAVLPWIEKFEVAPARDGADHRRYRTQIRAIPRHRAASVEFIYALPLADSGRVSFAELAWHVVGGAHRFRTERRHVDLAIRARTALEAVIRPTTSLRPSPSLIAVGVAFDLGHAEPCVTADLEMLGDDLTMSVTRITGDDVAPLERQALKAIDDHRRRIAVLRRTAADNVSGWIDQTAVRVIGLGRGEATRGG